MLIHELTKVLRDAGVTVKQAEADADHLIVTTALEIASQNGKQVVVVGTNTGLLVMLIAQTTASMDICMLCQSKPLALSIMKDLQEALGNTSQYMLFIHAVTGCDTTSVVCVQPGKNQSLQGR